jgi:hypothetical protein
MRALVLVLGSLLVACGSSKQDETPKPPLVVDCHAPPPSTTPPQLKCAGVCVAYDPCSDAGLSCPAGYVGFTGECDNGATCCVPSDAGADGSTDGSADAPAGAVDAAPG